MAIHEGLPPSGSEDKNFPPQNSGEGTYDDLSREIPADVTLPGDGHVTAQEAFNIGQAEQAEARRQVEAASSSLSLLDRFKKSRVARMGAKALALALVAGGGATIANAMNDKNEAPGSQPTYSAPVTPGPSEATKAPSSNPTTEFTPSPSAIETTPAFRYTPENPAQIAKIDSLVTLGQTPAESRAGVKQFELLTEKQRSSWNLSILDKVAQGYNPQVIMTTPDLDYYTFGGKNLADYNPIKSEMDESGGLQYTRQSTAEENFGLWLLQKNVTSAYTLLDQNSRPTAYNKHYSSILASGEVAAADPQTSKEYRNVVDSAMDSDSVSATKQDVLDSYTVKQGSELYPVKLGKETYEATTIEYQILQKDGSIDVHQVVRIFEPMPEELGKDKNGLDCGLWKTLTNKHIKTIPAPSK